LPRVVCGSYPEAKEQYAVVSRRFEQLNRTLRATVGKVERLVPRRGLWCIGGVV
jgi:hypothetical protein